MKEVTRVLQNEITNTYMIDTAEAVPIGDMRPNGGPITVIE